MPTGQRREYIERIGEGKIRNWKYQKRRRLSRLEENAAKPEMHMVDR